MATYNNVSLNGILLTPSKKDKKIKKIGALQESANGGRTWIQRVDASSNPIHKRTWSLKFEKVTNTTRGSVESLFTSSADVPFRDENGEIFTVHCEAEEYSESFEFRDAIGNLYYTVEITLHQV